MDDESLKYLLGGGHFNMEQRRERGIWPHPPLRFGECVRCLTDILERERWFPFEPKVRDQDDAVYEGVLVERTGDGSYICHCERSNPLVPNQVAERVEKAFGSAEDAARFYLRWGLQLPGDLDGWKVVA